MYGLVNQAIKDMICDRYGEQTWQIVQQKAEVKIDFFSSMESYPDDMTHRLVKAVGEVLNLSSAEVMQAFGKYWVCYTAREGYGEILDLAGDTLPEFLENLDELHARVGVIFPHLRPPSFDCQDRTENSLTLYYSSHRQGLAPMVIGLLNGLGDRFETEVKVEQTQSREEGCDRDVFSVHYRAANAEEDSQLS